MSNVGAWTATYILTLEKPVPHHRPLLIDKLKSYRISGNLLSWINSFLTGWLQQVICNSEWSNIVSKVPPGLSLGVSALCKQYSLNHKEPSFTLCL